MHAWDRSAHAHTHPCCANPAMRGQWGPGPESDHQCLHDMAIPACQAGFRAGCRCALARRMHARRGSPSHLAVQLCRTREGACGSREGRRKAERGKRACTGTCTHLSSCPCTSTCRACSAAWPNALCSTRRTSAGNCASGVIGAHHVSYSHCSTRGRMRQGNITFCQVGLAASLASHMRCPLQQCACMHVKPVATALVPDQ